MKTHLSLLVALSRRFVQRTVDVKVERQGVREHRLCPNLHLVVAEIVELAVVLAVEVELGVKPFSEDIFSHTIPVVSF